MKNLKHILSFIFICALHVNFSPVQSAESAKPYSDKTVRMRSFSMADGMPSNSIAMMSVGHNGLLWIATWNGLCNYDGYRFNTFKNEPGAKTLLHGNRLRLVYPADNGDVWFTTFDNHLFLLDASESRIVDCKEMLEDLGLSNFRVQYMQPLTDVGIWIQGADDENLIAKDSTIEKTNRSFTKTDHSTMTDSKGRIWEMADDGSIICQSKSSSGSVRKSYVCDVPDSWPKIHTDAPIMLEAQDGTLWFMPDKKTLCYYDDQNDSLVPFNLRKVGHTIPSEMFVSEAIVDKQKNLWFRNNFNLCQMVFCNSKFRFTPIVEGAETRSICVDSAGRMWIGTKQGHVALVDNNNSSVKYLTPDCSLSDQPAIFDKKGIYAIYEDSRHNVWLGTRGHGIYRLTPMGSGFWAQRSLDESDEEFSLSHIYDITEDQRGRIWLASYGGGIIFYDDNQQRFFTENDCPQLTLPQGNIRKMRRVEMAPDGTLIFSTTEGIVTLDSKVKNPQDITLNISQYQPSGDHQLLAPDVLQTLISRTFGTTFVSTMGGGLQHVESADLLHGRLKFGSVEHNFSNIGNIWGMIEDAQGKVWLVGENALHCFVEDENDRHTYTANDWISNNWGSTTGFSEARPVINSRTGEILLGTIGGIISFDPQSLNPSGSIPTIVFTGIQYQGEEQPTPLIGNAEITMPTDKQNAVVYFAALEYEDNLQVRYAFRIRGLDDTWNYVGQEHCASLSNLPPGHYVLEVRSTNDEGVWVDNNTEIPIYVEPTFWQTPWAWVIYVLVAALLILGASYLLWLRKAHRIEKEVNERQIRFFTDISHRVRTPLTLIDGPVTEVLNDENLSEKSRNLLNAVKSNSSKMLDLVDEALDLKKLRPSGSTATSQDVTSEPDEDGDSGTVTHAQESNYIPTDLTILIVEDNDELRYFLKTSLQAHYKIIEAANGKEGLRKAADHQPDFIITDIMMPVMDGITMLRRIKSDPAICHIPIIILSARTADIYRIEGLKEGADDYITKPFSMSYLLVRVESIVRQRHMLQEEWRKSLAPPSEETPQKENDTPGETSLSAIDQEFMNNITAYINDNLQNPDLKIDDVAAAMCMSRTVLYGKIKAIYGMSPNDVLRNMRIARACAILRQHPDMNIAEVALSVGYNDSKYFARYFKQTMGVNPSEYRKKG